MSIVDTYHDIDSIIQFSDESTKEAAREHYWKKLEESAADSLDFEALRICVHLLPSSVDTDSGKKLRLRLQRLISAYISASPDNEEQLYLLAGICLSNVQLGCLVFDNIITYMLTTTNPDIEDCTQETNYHRVIRSKEEHLMGLGAYYKFLKCSYWLSANQYHYITPVLVSLLIWSIGRDGLDEYAHDTLSALLTLLTSPSVIVLEVEALPETWVRPGLVSDKRTLVPGVLSDSFFDRLRDLPLGYFAENASKAFRTWFQWVSYMVTNAIQSEVLYSPEYWTALRTGLLTGSTEQRKYCLGIMQQSLLLCQRSFETSEMTFDADKKENTVRQYQRYCALFETIVLDRYPNQVQACLPELTSLLGSTSLINPSWVTALLSAALNSKVQDGVRKPVGNWYLDYATSQPGACTTHTTFLAEGFLPWATQGSLFTSSLVSTRLSTTCSHGEALTEAIAKLVTTAPGYPAPPGPETNGKFSSISSGLPKVTEKQSIVRAVLSFILDTRGKIFSPAVLYLLEGLLKGISEGHGIMLEVSDIDMIARISRLPAMPEITAELCRTYCTKLCGYRNPLILGGEYLPAQVFLDEAPGKNVHDGIEPKLNAPLKQSISSSPFSALVTLSDFLKELNRTQHKIIQNEAFSPACAHITNILDIRAPDSFVPGDLHQVLDAFWEEADRQDYPRPVAIRLAPLFFHPICVQVCIRQHLGASECDYDITTMLTKTLNSLHQFSEGRTYLVSGLAASLRKAGFLDPEIINILPLEDFFVRFITNPPVPKKEFMFEVVAAEKLEKHLPNLNYGKPMQDRDYVAYYGQREWMGYAAIIDLLNRIPEDQVQVAKRVLDRLLEPWRTQKAPIPIISKSKNVLQLQVMLLLTESCINERDADWYLDSFMHALILEPWPRYRYLLEWIITRIYFRFPSKTRRILDDLAKLDENSPVHIASLMKLALLAAPFLDSEEFVLKLMVQLIPLSASPKVHIRHEAHWCFPTLFDLANGRNWSSITDNPAFAALDKHVRSLDKFNLPPSTIRTLKLDAVKDFTLTNIFQGQYLRIETPDMEYVAHGDFLSLYESDTFTAQSRASPPRVPLGNPLPASTLAGAAPEGNKQASVPTLEAAATSEPAPTFFQTKSGFDFASLLPAAGPTSAQQIRPASVILVASLIDNPTNLGGLSRIAESFGLSALYIDDLKKTAHKDFKATSVTSEKHFPIRELKVPAIPDFLVDMKRQGYEVVGIEQTDRSGMLGESEEVSEKGKGTLPRKCVLVLGAERSGITSEVLTVVDRCVEIRTVGVTRSLNVQTAGGIAVYEWWREWGGML